MMTKKAMKLALEALDHNLLFTSLMPGYDGRIIEKAYKAINKALAEQQTDWEAVAADQALTIGLLKAELQEFANKEADALEVALTESGWMWDGDQWQRPSQRKPLTDEEIDTLREKHSEGRGAGWRFNFKGFAKAIETKLKEKNT